MIWRPFIIGSFASNSSSFKLNARSKPEPTATPATTATVNCKLDNN